jgi:hypothetical protein
VSSPRASWRAAQAAHLIVGIVLVCIAIALFGIFLLGGDFSAFLFGIPFFLLVIGMSAISRARGISKLLAQPDFDAHPPPRPVLSARTQNWLARGTTLLAVGTLMTACGVGADLQAVGIWFYLGVLGAAICYLFAYVSSGSAPSTKTDAPPKGSDEKTPG